MITDHAFRRFNGTEKDRPDGACAYMSCGRPREEHERAAWRGDVIQDGMAEAKAARS